MRIEPVAVFQTNRNQQDLRCSNRAASFSVTQLEAELNFTHANAKRYVFGVHAREARGLFAPED